MSLSLGIVNLYKLEDIQRWIDWLRSNSPESSHGILDEWQKKLNRFTISADETSTEKINDFHRFVKLEQEQWVI